MEYFRPIQIDKNLCRGCARCLHACTSGAIYFRGELRFIDYSKCKGCLKCVQVCPHNAITVASFEDGDIIAIDVDWNGCTGCGKCADICPSKIWQTFDYNKKGTVLKVYGVPPDKLDECNGCEVCVNSCPEKVISIQKI